MAVRVDGLPLPRFTTIGPPAPLATGAGGGRGVVVMATPEATAAAGGGGLVETMMTSWLFLSLLDFRSLVGDLVLAPSLSLFRGGLPRLVPIRSA